MAPLSKELLWSTGQDEDVEVNQRALIDKILARYSGEHTIFRELLQNSDDAGDQAHHVQIKFYTKEGLEALKTGEGPSRLPDVKTDMIHSYVVCNDGMPFRDEDWKRLKKIAEGNPDEEKIGAFGVGFYSLFSVCDGPFVESGDKWMAFHWKDGKDQLLARSGKLPEHSSPHDILSGNPWTTFTMALREPSLLEGPLDLARFFTTSITFMRTVRKIDMLVDGVCVFEVEKDVKGQEKVVKRGLKTTSSAGMMRVESVDATEMVITARIMKWLADTGFVPPPLPNPMAQLAKPARGLANMISNSFFGRYSSPAPPDTPSAPSPPPPSDPTEITILYREVQIYQANIKVTVSPTFGKELERATKKPPPSRMPASIVYSRGEDDEEAKMADGKPAAKDVAGVFSGLCPKLDSGKSARVFIGQPTGQTTGVGGHLAARFIPTVERESIDLVDKHVSHWNRQLLWIGGYLCRLIYELEMSSLATEWAKSQTSDEQNRSKIARRALHALRFFDFKPTTPSAVVGQEMEAAFYDSSTDNKVLPILSCGGILPIKNVRMPNQPIAKFLPDLPVVTPSVIERAPSFIRRLQAQRLLLDVTYDDVVRQLGTRPLTEKEMVECLLWWQTMATQDGFNTSLRTRLLDAAIVLLDSGKVLPMSTINTFVRPHSGTIPPDMPIPQHTVPYSITKDLKANSIYKVFGWTELNLMQYVNFLVSPPMSGHSGSDPLTDIRVSPEFSERVLSMLGRAWPSLASNLQSGIALELKAVPCIPTKAGFKKPEEAYFEKNLLFDDLPIIALPKGTLIKGGMEKMLLSIGVRKTVDLQLVFSRLVGGGTWSCYDLMRYLVSVRDTLSDEEVKRLRQTAAFPLFVHPTDDGSKMPTVRQKPWQLYEPTDAMKELGLPILDWGETKWRANSEEAKLLFTFGLNRHPSVETLLKIAAGRPPTNQKALEYLLANFHSQYSMFKADDFPGLAFIPATKADGEKILAKPGEAFTNPHCTILGFAVAHPSIATPESAAKLGLQRDPPMEQSVIALVRHITTDSTKARAILEYMSTQVGHASPASLHRLHDTPFIPVKEASAVKYYKPSQVYFLSKEKHDDLYATAFTFVDFGSQANMFLHHCGVKAEPSIKDIATLLITNPSGILQQAGSAEKYLEQLRLMAANFNRLDNQTRSAMRTVPFLLASQRVALKKSKFGFGQATSEESDEYTREWVLCRAADVVIIDDVVFSQYFGEFVLSAPEERILEEFYIPLGARPLSAFVRSQYVFSPSSQTSSSRALVLRKHVLERLTIFLAEARRKKSSYTAESLSQRDNFRVEEVQSVKVQHVYRNGKTEKIHNENLYASAAAGAGRTKSIVLTVSLSVPRDDYDIASALCEVLFKARKGDEALLLDSILTTPLMSLKKRGFNVDRILNQQREEKLRLQAGAKRVQEETMDLYGKQAEEQPQPEGKVVKKQSESSLGASSLGSSESNRGDGPSGIQGLISKFKGMNEKREKEKERLIKPEAESDSMPGGLPGAFPDSQVASSLRQKLSSRGGVVGGGIGGSDQPGSGSRVSGPGKGQTMKQPTDLSSIRSTVQQAMDRSRPETAREIFDSRQATDKVAEAHAQYCEPAIHVDLKVAYEASPQSGLNMQVWCPRDVDDVGTFLQGKMETCIRFIQDVLAPICKIYSLNFTVMNVFWDHEGGTIAFNKGGTVYCNARYFEAWHDDMCQRSQFTEAWISWYFSIAHELAHNLESGHNSSHEFFFSSIAEQYLPGLATLMAGPKSQSQTSPLSLVDIGID